jgi:DNA-binding response OmpR family regulator
VLVATDRTKALALLSTAHPDLIVVDVNGQTLELLDTGVHSRGAASLGVGVGYRLVDGTI